jgi:hypothetical protein
MLYREKGGG